MPCPSLGYTPRDPRLFSPRTLARRISTSSFADAFLRNAFACPQSPGRPPGHRLHGNRRHADRRPLKGIRVRRRQWRPGKTPRTRFQEQRAAKKKTRAWPVTNMESCPTEPESEACPCPGPQRSLTKVENNDPPPRTPDFAVGRAEDRAQRARVEVFPAPVWGDLLGEHLWRRAQTPRKGCEARSAGCEA